MRDLNAWADFLRSQGLEFNVEFRQNCYEAVIAVDQVRIIFTHEGVEMVGA